jgi:hypothetical protein
MSDEAFRPVVGLVMPHYGDVNLGAARGLLTTASRGGVDLKFVADSCSSATPHCFNGLLALALDARDRGEITHFAMLHSDIAPEEGWLDILWREMREHELDLISAVVPIKEPERLRTSTAIGSRDNPWYPDRYVTMADREKLPATFHPHEVCGEHQVLLVNTGCFLADLRRPWWDTIVGFQFDCRITFRDGHRIAQFNPEDWQMSRHIQASGGKLAATWAVKLEHWGLASWRNH